MKISIETDVAQQRIGICATLKMLLFTVTKAKGRVYHVLFLVAIVFIDTLCTFIEKHVKSKKNSQ